MGRIGRFFYWGDFARGEFSWRGNFPGGELSRRKFMLEEFAKIPLRNFMSCFLFTNSILHVEMLRVIFQGKFSPGLNYSEDICVGRGIFP